MTLMDDAQRHSLTSKEMLMTQQDTRNDTTVYSHVQPEALQSRDKVEKLAQQQDSDSVPDIITMLKELGVDYDKDVSLHRNPRSDQKGAGRLAQGFQQGRRS